MLLAPVLLLLLLLLLLPLLTPLLACISTLPQSALIFTAIVTFVEVSFVDAEGCIDALFIINRCVDCVFIADGLLQFFLMYPQAPQVWSNALRHAHTRAALPARSSRSPHDGSNKRGGPRLSSHTHTTPFAPLSLSQSATDTVRWIHDWDKISKNYLTTWFPLDFLSIAVGVFDFMALNSFQICGPETDALKIALANDETSGSVGSLKVLRVIRVARLVKLVRLVRSSRIMKR